MKAIILTAGFGRRMKPLTDNNHKTLLSVGNEFIINRIINSCIECGIEKYVIVTGYMANELREHINSHYRDQSFQYVNNKDYATTNNIYSLALAFENIEIDQDILLIESDLIFDSSILKNLISNPKPNVALVDRYRNGMDGTVVTVHNDRITNIIPPHLQSSEFQFNDKYKTLNIYKFSQEFSASAFKKLLTYYAKVIDDNCYYELILGILIYMQKEQIFAEIVNGEKWAEVDDPNDLRIAEFAFEEDNKLSILQSSFGGYWNYDIVDFCFIRNMYFPNGSVLSELKNNLESCLQNYGSIQPILNQKLAYYLLCNVSNVQVLNGVSQVYPILKNLLKNKSALIPKQTFGEYYKIFESIETYSDIDELLTFEKIIEQARDIDILLFVNPNNPSGRSFSTNEILQFAIQSPDKMVIVDESFIEFTDELSCIEILEKEPIENVLVLKSLSKNLGLPGIRLGYVYTTNDKLIGNIKNETPIWNLNSLAEFYLEIILKHRNTIQVSYDRTKKDRSELTLRLKDLENIEKVYKSGGNYILVRLASKKYALHITETLLKEYSVYVKDISNKFDDDYGYLRLAVRLPGENDFLVNCLREL
jgi:histidinol-phosphate/aromatic aminotransferase/cobyric acid decarboxylase-like protein